MTTTPTHSGAIYPMAHHAFGILGAHPLLAWILLGYLIIHALFYRHHRSRGLSVWVSMRGPFHTRISKRF